MKKLFHTEAFKRHQKRRALAELKRKRKKAGRKRSAQKHKVPNNLAAAMRDPRLRWNKNRRRFLRNFYRQRSYNEGPRAVELSGSIGLENDLVGYLAFSQSILDSYSANTFFDLTNIERLWPSAIMLFASHMKWVNLTRTAPVRIRSNEPKDPVVNSYLVHSGFYDFVGKSSGSGAGDFSDIEIVKIRQEVDKSNTKQRQYELSEMVSRHAKLTGDEVEKFDCVVLTEILLNVTEHGVPSKHSGWFVLGQWHPTTGIISICIGDNGIGIKNSLLSGAQGSEIRKNIKKGKSPVDSVLIESALTQFISGALEATPPIKNFLGGPKLERGRRRGQGLKRIVTACSQIGAKLTILSQHGCVQMQGGKIAVSLDTDKRCFAGTLYHIILPAKGRDNAKVD